MFPSANRPTDFNGFQDVPLDCKRCRSPGASATAPPRRRRRRTPPHVVMLRQQPARLQGCRWRCQLAVTARCQLQVATARPPRRRPWDLAPPAATRRLPLRFLLPRFRWWRLRHCRRAARNARGWRPVLCALLPCSVPLLLQQGRALSWESAFTMCVHDCGLYTPVYTVTIHWGSASRLFAFCPPLPVSRPARKRSNLKRA